MNSRFHTGKNKALRAFRHHLLGGRSMLAMILTLFIVLVIFLPRITKMTMKTLGFTGPGEHAQYGADTSYLSRPFLFTIKLPGEDFKQMVADDLVTGAWLGEGYSGTYQVRDISRTNRRMFEVQFSYIIEGKGKSETYKFDRKNFEKMMKVKKVKDPIEFTITKKPVKSASGPGPAVTAAVPEGDPAMRYHPCSGPVTQKPYVFMVFNGVDGDPERATNVWVNEFETTAEGEFKLHRGQFTYAVRLEPLSGGFKVETAFAPMSASGAKETRVKNLELAPKQLGTWQEFGETPRDNLAFMILSQKDYNAQVTTLSYPADWDEMKGVTTSASSAINSVRGLLVPEKVERYVMLFAGSQPMNTGADDFKQLKSFLIFDCVAEPEAPSVSGPRNYAQTIKVRPRIMPDLYPGSNPTLAGGPFDVFFTYEGKQYGNFYSAALKDYKARLKVIEDQKAAAAARVAMAREAAAAAAEGGF